MLILMQPMSCYSLVNNTSLLPLHATAATAHTVLLWVAFVHQLAFIVCLWLLPASCSLCITPPPRVMTSQLQLHPGGSGLGF